MEQLLLDFRQEKPHTKPLVFYIHDRKPNGACVLRGCVAKLPDGRVGYSWVNKKDARKSSKALARKIALDRAAKCVLEYDGMNGKWFRTRNRPDVMYEVPRELYDSLSLMTVGAMA